jgi:hypothetical protein
MRAWALATTLVVLLDAAAGADCGGGWESRAAMGIARQEIGVATIGTLLYAVGGFDTLGQTAAAEVYDSVADSWREIAPLPAALHHPGAASVGGKIYVMGGRPGEMRYCGSAALGR